MLDPRESVLKVFNQIACAEKDILIVMDNGSGRAASKIKNALQKSKKKKCMVGSWQLLPSQEDLEARAAYLGQPLVSIRMSESEAR